jgi:hypothetical protein
VGKNATVVFPAPLMTTIAELGSFLTREAAAASPVTPAAAVPPPPTAAVNAAVPNGAALPG